MKHHYGSGNSAVCIIKKWNFDDQKSYIQEQLQISNCNVITNKCDEAMPLSCCFHCCPLLLFSLRVWSSPAFLCYLWMSLLQRITQRHYLLFVVSSKIPNYEHFFTRSHMHNFAYLVQTFQKRHKYLVAFEFSSLHHRLQELDTWVKLKFSATFRLAMNVSLACRQSKIISLPSSSVQSPWAAIKAYYDTAQDKRDTEKWR